MKKGRKYLCKFEVGHCFDTSVAAMIRKDSGACPYCRGLRIDGSKSLAPLYPELAREWVICINDPSIL